MICPSCATQGGAPEIVHNSGCSPSQDLDAFFSETLISTRQILEDPKGTICEPKLGNDVFLSGLSVSRQLVASNFHDFGVGKVNQHVNKVTTFANKATTANLRVL